MKVNMHFKLRVDLHALLTHSAIFTIQLSTLVYDLLYMHNGVKGEGIEFIIHSTINYRGFPGKFKHLTFWCQIIQTVYFGISLYNDMFGSNLKPWDNQIKRHNLQNIRDKFFAAVAFPLGTFVVLTFWGIYAVDRELVYPEHLDKIIPSWLNHIMHTTVLPFLLLEQFFVYHHYPKRFKGLRITVSVAGVYLLWILWIAYYTGIWVYPVLQVLDAGGKVAFFSGLLGLLAIIYLIGEAVNKSLWGVATEVEIKKKF